MPSISLTDFVDFVNRAGVSKLTKVREIKQRGEYSPAFDFWKQLRDAIVEFHKSGKPLESVVEETIDPKRRSRYPGAVRAYKKFVGKKKINWFDPPQGSWTGGDLKVRINPELGLRFSDQVLVVKLYFKDEPLPKRRLAVIFQLMQMGLKGRLDKSATLAVLDVSKSKLIVSDPSAPDVRALLIGEAAAFVAMWNEI